MHRLGSVFCAVLLAGLELHLMATASAQTIARSHPTRLSNVSIRAGTAGAESPVIGGAVVRGQGTIPLLIRGIGPGLGRFGVANFLRAPQLEVYRDATLTARTNTAAPAGVVTSANVGAFPLVEVGGAPGGDAALVGEPGAGNITAHCVPASGAGGVALLEFYDATPTPTDATPRIVNFSARAQVESGEGLMVVGFVVAGEGEIKLLLRASGPTLQAFNVPGFLGDPVIELYAGTAFMASNDNWQSSASMAAIQAAGDAVGAFALSSPNDAAMLVTLPPGSYTLQVRGSAGGTGIALAEIYEVPVATQFDAAQATNAVGLELYRLLAAADANANLVLSPYSIETALALAYAGADGATRREMATVLRLPDDSAALQSGFAAIRTALEQLAEESKQLAARRRTDPLEWHAANRLFGQQGFAFRDSFLTLMRDGFAAPLQLLDFRTNPEPARLTINGWVEEQTRARIQNLIPPGALTDFTRLVLVNALYLKVPWEELFMVERTQPAPFRTASGTTRDVPTMSRNGTMGYAVENGTTILTLDYLGGGLQFVIILPAEGTTTDAVASRLTSSDFARWARLGNPPRSSVSLFLPKFRVDGATVALKPALKAMGMKSAFDDPIGSSNFDRIALLQPGERLYISDVYHQTFIALDEGGTEAAAATAVVIDVTVAIPPPPIEVRIDRPFLFAIQHRASGACLFLGRITDPR